MRSPTSMLRRLALVGSLLFVAAPALAQDEEEAAPAREEPAAAEPAEATNGEAAPVKKKRRKRVWLPLKAVEKARAEAAAKAEAAAQKAAARAAAKAAAAERAAARAAAAEPATTPPTPAAAVPGQQRGEKTAPAAEAPKALAEVPVDAQVAVAQTGDSHPTGPGHATAEHVVPSPHVEHAATALAKDTHGVATGHAAPAEGHGGGHAAGHEGFSVTTFIFQLINFGGLLFLLIYFGGRAMNRSLRLRHGQIKGEIDDATRLRDEANQKLVTQEKRIALLEKEIASLHESMRKEAVREQERMLEAAQERAKRMQEDVRVQIEEQLKVAEAALRAEAANASVKLAEELARKALTFEDERRLAREFVASFAGGARFASGEIPRPGSGEIPRPGSGEIPGSGSKEKH